MTAESESPPLLAALAKGILALVDDRPARAVVPYPESAQSALDRVALARIRRGERPPSGIPELLAWARECTIGELAFAESDWDLLPDDRFIDAESAMPTRTCIELASVGPGRVWEHQARDMLTELAASTAESQRAGDLMAEHPAMTTSQSLSFVMNAATVIPWQWARKYYRSRPPAFLTQNGELRSCQVCRLPACTSQDRLVTWCEGGECPGRGKPADVSAAADVALLAAPLRAFHVLPARKALELRTLCASMGTVGSVPGTSGVFTVETAGTRRLVRVVDRVQPALIAADVAKILVGDPTACIVVPERTMTRHSRYRAILTATVPESLAAGVMTDHEFLATTGVTAPTIRGEHDA
jgi:hypothetical protein